MMVRPTLWVAWLVVAGALAVPMASLAAPLAAPAAEEGEAAGAGGLARLPADAEGAPAWWAEVVGALLGREREAREPDAGPVRATLWWMGDSALDVVELLVPSEELAQLGELSRLAMSGGAADALALSPRLCVLPELSVPRSDAGVAQGQGEGEGSVVEALGPAAGLEAQQAEEAVSRAGRASAADGGGKRVPMWLAVAVLVAGALLLLAARALRHHDRLDDVEG